MDKTSILTLSEALNKASLFLRDHGHEDTLARTYWMLTFDRTLTDLVLALNMPVAKDEYDHFFAVLERVVQDEPIQYILGYADFMDRRFKVDSSTLIPREDTAGIIDIVRPFLRNKPQAKILDIGTGTGIIAVTLALEFPEAEVFASDISKEALDVAKLNADHHQARIQFVESDVFDNIEENDFDLIVSNPPYISEEEVNLMDASVKKFEPYSALFADHEGLAIYERIAEQVSSYIKTDGILVVEIGFQQGEKVSRLFKEQLPQSDVEVLQDLNQKDRYVQVMMGGR